MGFPEAALFRRRTPPLFGDPAAQLIIDTQEYLRILPVVGKGDDIQNVCDDPVGKECVVRLAAAIGYPVPVQQVDQRQDTVVVAVQDGDLSVGVRRRENEPRVLGGTVRRPDQVHACAGGPGGADGFGSAVVVPPDKCIRCPENLRGGAIIFLHQQHPGSGIGALKLHQRIRISGTEAVNALILVAHQEIFPDFRARRLMMACWIRDVSWDSSTQI